MFMKHSIEDVDVRRLKVVQIYRICKNTQKLSLGYRGQTFNRLTFNLILNLNFK